MSGIRTMVRTQVVINGKGFLLAQGQDFDDLRQRIVAAVQTAGRFVEFTVVGNRALSVLIGPGAQVVFSVETVQFDPRDTGDEQTPFGGMFDH